MFVSNIFSINRSNKEPGPYTDGHVHNIIYNLENPDNVKVKV